MRNLHKWLLALGVATVLVTAIMFTQHSAKVNEQKLKSQMQKLEAQTKSQHDAEVENLKKQIQEQDSKYKQLEQTKAAEKARIAAETAQKAAKTPVVSKVVQTIVPTAQAATSDVQGLIVKWANTYGVDPNWLLRVAKCESNFNPSAQNKGYYAGGGNPSGVFQFLPQTFSANAARAGIPGANLWDVDSQAHVAAYMFSIGQSGQWACK